MHSPEAFIDCKVMNPSHRRERVRNQHSGMSTVWQCAGGFIEKTFPWKKERNTAENNGCLVGRANEPTQAVLCETC
jgi:hypothetical protein